MSIRGDYHPLGKISRACRGGPTRSGGGGTARARAGGAGTGREDQRVDEGRQTHQAEAAAAVHVILWNDNDHSYAYVVAMLQKLFGHPPEKGYQLAKEVDTRGKAIVMTTTREHAELKRDQIHAFGKDDLIDGCKGSMSSTIEPSVG